MVRAYRYYPVAFHHASDFRRWRTGTPCDRAAIGDDALAAVFAQPNESGAVAAVGVGMTIQALIVMLVLAR